MTTRFVHHAPRNSTLWVSVVFALSAVGFVEARPSSSPPVGGVHGAAAPSARADEDGIDEIEVALRDICDIVTCYWMRSDGNGDFNNDVSAVVACYENNGVDPHATPEERSNAVGAIGTCSAWLDQNPGALEPGVEADFVQMLARLSDDLQP
ncbi:MAG TPA: hypothetical protein VD971_03160 [Phycisphaerales bacterium]|nr:hypothetical protein [Phycisphaerales bacterium]